MASSDIIAACDRVLVELMALKLGLEDVSEDSEHPLHNPLLGPAMGTDTERCFAKVDTNAQLRTEFAHRVRTAIDALCEVAQRSEETAANTRCIWATWAATYGLYNYSFTLYDDIKIDDIEFTCVYQMAHDEEVRMHTITTEFGGEDTYSRMGDFEQWIWEDPTPLSVLLEDEEESVARWVDRMGSKEFHWSEW